MIPPHILDEIKARVSVSELVGQKVKLARSGRELKGLSPFTEERTPSFFVNDAKGFYHCFSTGKHGDVFDWLQEAQGLTFAEAVETLAARAGVTLPKAVERDPVEAKVRTDLVEVNELAAKWFEANLHLSGGEPALDYCRGRKLAPETLRAFRIGFAPRSGGLKAHLAGKGVPLEVMMLAGLVLERDGGEAYDFFRGRLMIPIQDHKGLVIGFGGRTLDSGGQPKYLNTPKTPLFDKGTVVFNLHRALDPARAAGTVAVVEGYLDVIAVHQAGYRPVVACLGTALTEQHVARLWRLAPEPVLCLDGDKAGIAAAARAVNVVLPGLVPGRSLNFTFLRDGKDPDDVVREGGREAFEKALARAVPLVDVLWRRELAAARTDTPERRAAFEARLAELVAAIKDPKVRSTYRSAVRMRLADLFSWRRSPPAGQQAKSTNPELPNGRDRLDGTILGMAVEFPALLDEHLERIAGMQFKRAEFAAFRDELVRLAGAGAFDPASVDQRFGPVLHEVHGTDVTEEAGGAPRARGDRLRQRMPILCRLPPPHIVERAFLASAEAKAILEAEEEIAAAVAAGPDDDDEIERILAMRADLSSRRAASLLDQQGLMDEIAATRAAAGG